MTKIDDGGSAFPEPLTVLQSGDAVVAYPGMTLRQYYAGQALACMKTHHAVTQAEAEDIARSVFLIADAIIAAGKEPPK